MISLTSLGTVQSYTQSMKAKNLWEQRKQSGYYDKLAERDPARASVQEQADKMHQLPDTEREAINRKLRQGKTLTYAEKEKLRTTDPGLYEKVQNLEAEKKRYEQELKHCKTKDDVQRLKLQRLQSSMHTVNTVSNNPNIPLEKKLEIAEHENMRVNTINRATERFVTEGSYARLPTQQEVNSARREEAELERPTPEAPPQTPEAPQEPQSPAPSDQDPEAEAAPAPPPEQSAPAAPTEKPAKVLSDKSRRVLATYRRAAATRPPDLEPLLDEGRRAQRKPDGPQG